MENFNIEKTNDSMEITKHNIFINEAWSFTMPNHEKWRKEIKDIILVENNKEIHHHTTIIPPTNVKAKRTAWDSHFRYPQIRSLTDALAGIIEDWIKKENFDAPYIKVHDCWINWYNKNDHAVPHVHGTHLSLVYFVDVEDAGAEFLFHKDGRFVLIRKKDNETFSNNLRSVKVKNGTVLMFSGGLTHFVTPNLSDNTRITFAANYEVSYEKKREDY